MADVDPVALTQALIPFGQHVFNLFGSGRSIALVPTPLTLNAGGDAESAGDQVDSAWRDYLADARAVLRTLREPDQKMAAAGDPAIWERMVLAAIAESKPETVVL